jgi:hypothetical protein
MPSWQIASLTTNREEPTKILEKDRPTIRYPFEPAGGDSGL